jgi:hypothetical protein
MKMANDKYLIATITGITGAGLGLGYLIYKATRPPVSVEKPEEAVVTVSTPTPDKPVEKGVVTISESISDLITSGNTAASTIFDRITEFIKKPEPIPEPVVEDELPTILGEETEPPTSEEPVVEDEISTVVGEETEPPEEPTIQTTFIFPQWSRNVEPCSYKDYGKAYYYTGKGKRWVQYKDKEGKYHEDCLGEWNLREIIENIKEDR